MLRIYEGSTLAFETKLTPGVFDGQVGLASIREGVTDLVVVSWAGRGYLIQDFQIIGIKADGDIGVLADRSLLKRAFARPKLSELEGKIGLEATPLGLWTRYRIDFIWDQDTD